MSPYVLDKLLQASLVSWLIGLIGGGGLGAICAYVARLVFSRLSVLRRPCMFLPWRSLLFGWVLWAWLLGGITYPVLAISLNVSAVAHVMFVLALLLTANALLEHWSPSSPAIRLVAGGRTLAVASVMAAVVVGGGIGSNYGSLLHQYVMLLRYEQAHATWLVVVALALAVDGVWGIVQAITSYVAEKCGRTQVIRQRRKML